MLGVKFWYRICRLHDRCAVHTTISRELLWFCPSIDVKRIGNFLLLTLCKYGVCVCVCVCACVCVCVCVCEVRNACGVLVEGRDCLENRGVH